jgi:hypothetical protein
MAASPPWRGVAWRISFVWNQHRVLFFGLASYDANTDTCTTYL